MVNRFSVYKANVEKINSHNEKFISGEAKFSMKENQFADLTSEEFAQFVKRSGL